MQYELAIIEHEVEDGLIHQRASDGYVNATAMCKAAGKLFGHYRERPSTNEFLEELSSVIGIPISELVISIKGGQPELQGTWVHPKVAIHLGQWCSPKFAVAVAEWVHDWMSGKIKGKLPYHLERYMANRTSIPVDKFSMLNELTFVLIAPLESAGYTLPDNMVPDISTGLMFCKWLREHGVEPNDMPSYMHHYGDGRIVEARLYPNSLLEVWRAFYHNEWVPKRALAYFKERDPGAFEVLSKILPTPDTKKALPN